MVLPAGTRAREDSLRPWPRPYARRRHLLRRPLGRGRSLTYADQVRLDRREFFRIAGAALGTLAAGSEQPGRADEAAEATTALGIHRRTRNTRAGPFGRISLPGRAPAPFKSYPGSRRVKLPASSSASSASSLPLGEAVRGYAPTAAFSSEALSLAELARLLRLTNGVTGRTSRGAARRAAPSAGALYAGEVYVLAERVLDLAPGVYYYAVLDHELVEIRSGAPLGAALLALEEAGPAEGAASVVVLTNVFQRYVRRYGDRGYRYALIDTGHQGENLRLAAFSAGLGDLAPLRFEDDRLNELVGIDGREEAVCAVHVVGRRGEPTAGSAQPPRVFAEKRVVDPAALAKRGPEPERYHEATKLVPAASPSPLAGRTAPAEIARPPGASLPLPRGIASPPASVDETIHVRRSTRSFESGPLALDDLGFVLGMAQGHAALERAPGVELFVVAHRVRGLGAGLYRYGGLRGSLLASHRMGDLREALTRTCLGQAKAGEAGVAIAMVAEVARSAAARGERAYRDLLVEAGAIGERVYLAAEACGLSARNLAAFRDGELNALLGTDGRERAVIHLTLVGRGD